MRKVKRIRWENILKLIIMGICLGIILSDFGKLFISIFQDISISFTWYGLYIDMSLLILFGILFDDLFGDDNDRKKN